jgi:hypothetical protein
MTTTKLIEYGGHRVLVADASCPMIGSSQDALRSGLAGEFLQKTVNYRGRFAVTGDISEQITASTALRDFVVECNRGRSIFSLPDLAAVAAKISELTELDETA